MHDEVELISAKPPNCVHSIQMSNGMEIQIPFREITLEQAESFFPFRNAIGSGREVASAPGT
jgi:hypothetical protein